MCQNHWILRLLLCHCLAQWLPKKASKSSQTVCLCTLYNFTR